MRSVAGISDDDGASFFENAIAAAAYSRGGSIDTSSIYRNTRNDKEMARSGSGHAVACEASLDTLLSAFNALLWPRVCMG